MENGYLQSREGDNNGEGRYGERLNTKTRYSGEHTQTIKILIHTKSIQRQDQSNDYISNRWEHNQNRVGVEESDTQREIYTRKEYIDGVVMVEWDYPRRIHIRSGETKGESTHGAPKFSRITFRANGTHQMISNPLGFDHMFYTCNFLLGIFEMSMAKKAISNLDSPVFGCV